MAKALKDNSMRHRIGELMDQGKSAMQTYRILKTDCVTNAKGAVPSEQLINWHRTNIRKERRLLDEETLQQVTLPMDPLPGIKAVLLMPISAENKIKAIASILKPKVHVLGPK